MITEDYVSFEVAKLLKEKGFNIPCDSYYFTGNNQLQITFDFENDWNNTWEHAYTRPTHQMAMKWLRETYKLHIEVEVLKPYVLDDTKKRTVPSDRVEFHASIIFTDQWNDALEEFKNTGVSWHNTYEEAVEEALKYCLTNLI